jgi:hypothetical protein
MLVAVYEDQKHYNGDDDNIITKVSSTYHYLVLEETEETNHYRRIGIGRIPSSALWKDCERVLVHLK